MVLSLIFLLPPLPFDTYARLSLVGLILALIPLTFDFITSKLVFSSDLEDLADRVLRPESGPKEPEDPPFDEGVLGAEFLGDFGILEPPPPILTGWFGDALGFVLSEMHWGAGETAVCADR